MQKRFQIFLIISFVVILVVVIGLVYWSKGKAIPAAQTQMPSIGQSVEPQSGPKADWKTYRNVEYGFEVKYPHNWTDRNLTIQPRVQSNYLSIIAFNPQAEPTGDIFTIWISEKFKKSEFPCSGEQKGDSILVDGESYVKCLSRSLGESDFNNYGVYLDRGSFLYGLICTNRKVNTSACDEITSSFRFLK